MDLNVTAEIAGAIAVGLIGISLGLQRVVKNWSATRAETSVISIMHSELERMSAQNSLLAKELNKLQLEIIKLTKELHKLSVENQRLNTEISALTKEVSRLQQMLLAKTLEDPYVSQAEP